MKKLLIMCSTIACTTFAAAQIRIDAGIGLGQTIARTSFSQLPGFSSCSPVYEGGSAWGGMVGVGIDIPIASSFFGAVRVNAVNRGHSLSTEERVDIIAGNELTQAAITHTMTVPLTEYGIETQLGWRRGNFVVRAGAGYAIRSFGVVVSQEELTRPRSTVFSDTKSSVRNRISGALPAAINGSWSVMGIVGLEFPLAKGSRWRLTPEASLTAGLNSLTSVTSWKIVTPGFALRLSYEFPERQPVIEPDIPAPPAKVIAARVPEPPVEAKVIAPATKRVVRQRIVIEELEEERFMPILPYIFFERATAEIPARYQVAPNQERRDKATSNLAAHHAVLAVIADRMKSDPSARVVLTGHISSDEQDTRLALQRARAVAAILTDSFGIDPQRIGSRARRLPLNLSRATGDESVFADEENRRVEITSMSPSLLLPYRVTDTVMTVTKPEDALLTASDSVIIIADTVRLVEKRRTMVQDSIVERFDLVVFPFAKTDLSDDHRRILDLVRSRIGQNARVLVEGSTDPLGPTEENAKLSLQRAQNVARELQGNITVIGRGEAPVDPSRMLPEERMFQRVVSIYALVPRTK